MFFASFRWRAWYQALHGKSIIAHALMLIRSVLFQHNHPLPRQALECVLRRYALSRNSMSVAITSFKNLPVPFDSTTLGHGVFINISNGQTNLNLPQKPQATLIFGTDSPANITNHRSPALTYASLCETYECHTLLEIWMRNIGCRDSVHHFAIWKMINGPEDKPFKLSTVGRRTSCTWSTVHRLV